MRKTISEYGRIIIMAVIILIVGGLIFGFAWANHVRNNIEDPDTIQIANPSGRAAPIIFVQDQATSIDKELDISNIFSAEDADGNDITNKVTIECDEKVYNKTTKIFKSSEPGFYEMTFKVTDESTDPDNKYFLTATKKINILVDDSIGKYTITIMEKANGRLTTNLLIASENDNIILNINPDKGYKFNGATYIPNGKKVILNKNNEYYCPNCSFQINTNDTECDNCKTVLYFEKNIDSSTTSFVMPAYDIILTPLWVAETYKVKLNTLGGTLSGDSLNEIEVTYNQPYGNLPIPTKKGYSFNGWYNADNEKITEDNIVIVAGAHELNAKWTPKTFTITYDANGGTIEQTSQTVTYDSYIGNMPFPVKKGCIFAGWYLSDNASKRVSSIDKYGYDEDIVLKARWVEQNFTVTFDSNGGVLENAIISGFRSGEEYGKLPIPVHEGYIFDGWYTAINGGNLITSKTIFGTSDQTLYAHWSEGSIIYVNSVEKAALLSSEIGDSANYDKDQRTAYIDGAPVYMVYDRGYTLGESGLFSSDGYKNNIVALSIGNNCTSVANNAFNNCVNLNGSIYIPEKIQSIGSSAFYNTSLDNVTFATQAEGKNPSLISISSYAFSNIECDGNPVELILPESLKEIKNNAFENNTIFGGKLIIPESVHIIGVAAFKNCDAFNDLLRIPNSIAAIPESAFENCDNINELQLLDGVSSIGVNAFANCNNIKKITMPITVTTTGGSFLNCKADYFYITKGNGNVVSYDNINGAMNLPWNVTSVNYTVEIDNEIKNIGSNIFTLGSNDAYFKTFILPIDTKLNASTSGLTFTSAPQIEEYIFTGTASMKNDGRYHDICQSLTYTKDEALNLPWNKNSSATGFKATFENGITTINENMFYDSRVSNIVIKDSVSKIYAGAFSGCSNLVNLTIPITIDCDDSQFAKITRGALTGAIISSSPTKSLLAVNFTPGTTHVTYGTTSGISATGDGIEASLLGSNSPWITSTADGLKCAFTNGCKVINERYCYGADALTEVILNADLENIKTAVFDGCDKLSKITIANSTKYENGSFALVSSKFNDITIIQGKNSKGEDITAINYTDSNDDNDLSYKRTIWYLSRNVSGLKITLDDSISSIGNYSFYGSNYNFGNGTELKLPKNAKKIGEKAFESTQITKLTLSSGLEYIGQYAFANNALTDIDTNFISESTGILNIDNYAFYNNKNLKNVSLVNTVENLGAYLFDGCSKITSFNADKDGISYIPTSVKTIGDCVFRNCSGVTFNLSNCENLISIGDSAFSGSGIINVSLPSSVTSIKSSVFKNCRYLLTADLANIKTDFNLSGNDSLFSGCISLGEVKIPETITCIPNFMFNECVSLKKLNATEKSSFNIPLNITCIGESAFMYCQSAIFNFKNYDKLTQIGAYAFTYSGIKEVILGESVTEIGGYTFTYCEFLTYANLAGIKADISSNNGMFGACTSLKTVHLPSEKAYISAIPDVCFHGCTSLKELNPTVDNLVNIPNGVEKIGVSAFYDCTSLESINTNNVQCINEAAFYGCAALQEIDIGMNLQTICEKAFYNCSSLNKVNIQDVAKWCNIEFALSSEEPHFDSNPLYYAGNLYLNDKIINDLIIPSNTQAIKDIAFIGCTSLKTVTVESGVESIGVGAFAYCNALEQVDISDTVTSIENSAFSECTSLKSINVNNSNKNYSSNGEGVLYSKDLTVLYKFPENHPAISYTTTRDVTVEQGAFSNCKNLEEITLPGAPTIKINAFANSKKLQKVFLHGEPKFESFTNINYSPFYSCNNTLCIYLLKNTEEEYNFPEYWRNISETEKANIQLGGWMD